MYIMCHMDLNTCSELAGISLEWCFFLVLHIHVCTVHVQHFGGAFTLYC